MSDRPNQLGRELEEDFRKKGPNLKHWLIRDFELEILLAETFRESSGNGIP
jgi:hypothetical protein